MRLRRLQRRRSFEATCCAIQQRMLRPRRHQPARRSFLLGEAAYRRLLGTGPARPGASVNLQLRKRTDLSRKTPRVLQKKVLIHPKKSGCSLGGWGISMVSGFDILGRIPGVELGPGVESPLGVGVLDFRPGVPALSRWWREKVDTKSITGHSSGHQTD